MAIKEEGGKVPPWEGSPGDTIRRAGVINTFTYRCCTMMEDENMDHGAWIEEDL